MRLHLLALLTLCVPTPASAQAAGAGRPGLRALMPRTDEIALARSAAPASISTAARVYVLSTQGWVVADSGTSGVACLVNRSWPASLEPECFDEEAAATIMPMEMRRTELLHRGKPVDQADQEIAKGLMDGTFRLPGRLAVVYMMSAGQKLISDEGQAAGKPTANLMVIVPEFIPVATASAKP